MKLLLYSRVLGGPTSLTTFTNLGITITGVTVNFEREYSFMYERVFGEYKENRKL